MQEQHRWYGVRPWSRHSLVLLIAGFAYIGIGIVYMFVVPGGPRDIALVVARAWMPISWWSWVFVLVGVGTVISSRWPPTKDKWGYAMLTGLSTGWGTFYFVGVILDTESPTSNLSGAITWWLVGFLWWAISGLMNPGRAVVIPYGRSTDHR